MIKITAIKKIMSILISLVLLCLAGCNKAEQFSLIKTEKVNYNNLYEFAHPMLWVNENCVYYAKNELYKDVFYYADEKGKHKIPTNFKTAYSIDIELNGEVDDIQAYGDSIYLLYKNKDGTNLFYLYSKSDKSFKELFYTKENVNDWAVVDNLLIYSAFLENQNTKVNSLWYFDLNVGKQKQIAAKTIAFGIMNNTICYIQKSNDGKCNLYNFNFESGTGELKRSFKYSIQNYNDFNFTNDSVVFFKNGLSVLNVESGDLKSFDLPGYARFMSVYEEYGFVCLEKSLYRINLQTGESLLLYEFDECNLVHAISDDCAVIVCYENADSLLSFSVKTYAVKSDGTVEELFEI